MKIKIQKIIIFLVITVFISINIIMRSKNFWREEQIEAFRKPTENKYFDVDKQNGLFSDKIRVLFDSYQDFAEIILYGNRKLPNEKNMIPQGITTFNNLYTIIAAYDYKRINESKIYLLNVKGKIVNIVTLDTNSHVGSIDYDKKNNLFWIPDNEGVLNAYDASDFVKKNNTTAKYRFNSVSNGLEEYRSSYGSLIDYLCVNEDYIYLGSFAIEGPGNVKKYKIKRNKTDIALQYVSSFKVPPLVQGITFYEYNNEKYMILSLSFGRKRDSKLLVYRYKEEINDYRQVSSVELRMPPMLEQIHINSDKLYALFESNVPKYKDCKAKIDCIVELDIEKIIKKYKEKN